MTAEALTFVSSFFADIWKFFNSWKLPGTNVTPAAWAFFLRLCLSSFVFLSVCFLPRMRLVVLLNLRRVMNLETFFIFVFACRARYLACRLGACNE